MELTKRDIEMMCTTFRLDQLDHFVNSYAIEKVALIL